MDTDTKMAMMTDSALSVLMRSPSPNEMCIRDRHFYAALHLQGFGVGAFEPFDEFLGFGNELLLVVVEMCIRDRPIISTMWPSKSLLPTVVLPKHPPPKTATKPLTSVKRLKRQTSNLSLIHI